MTGLPYGFALKESLNESPSEKEGKCGACECFDGN